MYPFDLENGPLLEVRLLRLGEQEHILLLTMHHIISDGWSWGVLLHELAVLYDAFSQGQPSPLPELPMQYADYAHWQRQWLHSEAGKAQLAYWMQQLHDPLPILELPTDRPRTAELSLHTARQSFQLPKELTVALTRLSRQEGTTVFMTLLAAFKTLLYGYTGQEDIRVGTLVANRQHQETEGLIGLFANLVILRTNLGGNPSLRQVLQRVRTTTLDAYAHQDLPFEYLARTLVRARQCDRQSLFQVMFAMQNARQHTLELPGLSHPSAGDDNPWRPAPVIWPCQSAKARKGWRGCASTKRRCLTPPLSRGCLRITSRYLSTLLHSLSYDSGMLRWTQLGGTKPELRRARSVQPHMQDIAIL